MKQNAFLTFFRRFFSSDTLEQFKFEKIIGIQKSTGKVRKSVVFHHRLLVFCCVYGVYDQKSYRIDFNSALKPATMGWNDFWCRFHFLYLTFSRKISLLVIFLLYHKLWIYQARCLNLWAEFCFSDQKRRR